MVSIGFIILRHVNSEKTGKYWKISYESIRKFYPENNIMIIDDNSNYEFIDTNYENTLASTTIIKSEYPGKGEILPYIYYLKNKLFDIAVIIHDSVFINKQIDFNVQNYKILWEFEHKWDQPKDEITLISKLDNYEELLIFHSSKQLWKGCFGCMSVITYDYLNKINDKFNISLLLPGITSRHNRMSIERVIACLLQYFCKNQSICGNIHKYCKFGLKFEEMKTINHLPIIKVWTGR
jgi:hypothetical protein